MHTNPRRRHHQVRRLAPLAVLALSPLLFATSGPPAAAGVPSRPSGPTGTISFTVNDEENHIAQVWLVNADGSGEHQLTGFDFSYAGWSLDGTRLAMIGDTNPAPTPDPPHVGWDVDPVTGAMSAIPYPNTDLTVICYRWSPDRSRLACEAWNDADLADPRGGIYTLRPDGQDLRPVVTGNTGEGMNGTLGGYSPDGKTIVSDQQLSPDDWGLFLSAADGSWTRRLTPSWLLVWPTSDTGGDFSPDGSRIVFTAQVDHEHRRALWTVRTDGTGLERVRVQMQGKSCGGKLAVRGTIGCSDPSWSPDGKWLAYQVNSVNPTDIHVARVDGSDDRLLVTGAEQPDWGGTAN
jgi:Tol biopolymer transport system component